MRKRPMCLACLGFMLVLVLLRIAGVPLGTPFSDPKYENKAQQGRKVWIAGTIETYEKKSSNNGYVLRGEGSKGKIYLLAKRGDLPVGAAVRVYGTVKKPESPRNPGMFDEKTYYEGKGCAFYVISEREEVVNVGRWNLGEALRLERERMLFGITMFFACVLLFYRPRETFSITALDVGQGDALVVESGRFLMLNDGGSSSASAIGEKRILPYLKQRGIAALDAVVVTHPDADHTNGILELLELIGEQKTALRIRHLFLPVWMKGSEKENPFILAAQKAGIMVEYLKKGDEIRAGELTVSVLHPGAGEDYTGEENAGSVVLQLSCGACRALLTGDLEGSGEEEVLGAAERCQILKVAHHGSRKSTSEAFLHRIQPQLSLISCAWPGRYGHPHRELLERLRACKSHIYGTPVDGAVTVQLKRDRLAVHGYRSDVEFPVS